MTMRGEWLSSMRWCCIDDTSPCIPETFVPHCVDSAPVVCMQLPDGRSFTRTWECSSAGGDNLNCVMGESGTPMCGQKTCSLDQPGSSCDGDLQIYCNYGVSFVEQDCSKADKICVTVESGVGGESFCAVPEECADSYCDGYNFVECHDGWVAEVTDCRYLADGFTCVQRQQGHYAGCGVEEESVVCEDEEAICSGPMAKVCVGGGWVSFDCGEFGDGYCVVSGDGAHGLVGDGVRCVTAD